MHSLKNNRGIDNSLKDTFGVNLPVTIEMVKRVITINLRKLSHK